MTKCLAIALVSTFFIFVLNSEVVKRSTCKENEMHVECAHCGPKSCDDLGSPIPCGGGTARCRPECVCIDGHVRDSNGTCIPKKECPGCGGDRNATSGCGNHCGNSCSDHMEANKTCLTGCRYNSCDCRIGYVYNDVIGKCVLPVDCFAIELTGVNGVVKTDNGEKSCETKIHACSIKLDNIGLSRLPGETGVPGPPGPMGPEGLKGEMGFLGLPGDKGPKGDKGADGLRGEFGSKGETGDQGPPGPTGPEGLKGGRGPPGPMGPEGLKGEMGLSGLPGLKGPKGDKGADGPGGENGTKGETGDQGPPGPMGPEGLKGEKGADGPKGENGTTGETGDQGPLGPTGPIGVNGEKGTDGPKGENGAKGEKGDQGLPGSKGPEGLKGENGLPGIKGDVGVPGLPGRDGSCSCVLPDVPSDDGKRYDGSEDTYPLHSCKFAPKGTETGKYWVCNEFPFEVECDMSRNMTCLLDRGRANESTIERESITHQDKPFWLSEIMNFDLEKFYGITTKQLDWLQKESPLITQEIIYHCKNSYIVHKGDKSGEEALHLLSWKDKVIGRRPSNNSPYYYSILEDDGCKDSGEHKTEWKHSTIMLRSRYNGLPIIDFHINDIRVGEEQKFYIEFKKLCFNN